MGMRLCKNATAQIGPCVVGIQATIIEIVDSWTENGRTIVTNTLISLTRFSFQR